MTAAIAVVSPSNSSEAGESCGWQAKLESGSFAESDWELVASPEQKTRIPWLHQVLHPSQLPRHSSSLLVRTVAVVQDQLDLEFFLSPPSSQLRDRLPLILVPLSSSPSCTPWFQEMILTGTSTSSSTTGSDPDRPSKRLRLDDEEPSGEGPRGIAEENSTRRDPPFVVAKLYYDQYAPDSRRLQLNDVVEVIGVLESSDDGDGALLYRGARHYEEEDLSQPQWSYDSWEGEDHCVAPSQAPRLHVLWYRTTDLDGLAATDATGAPALLPSPILPPSRALARSLSVSDTVATAIWMALLSMAERKSVQLPAGEAGKDSSTLWAPVETPQDTTLGCASLNLVAVSSEDCAQLHERLTSLLQAIVPLVQAIAITDPESLPLLPTKRAGRLHPSPLQLPKGSALILNVGSCDRSTAALASSAAKPGLAWKALQELTGSHKLGYSFEGIPIAFEADLRIIVLSTPATRHLLPCTVQCAVTTTGGSNSNGVALSADGVALRLALAHARGVGSAAGASGYKWASNIGFSAPVLDRAQQDFLQRRQRARQQPSVALPNESDFHRWLTLTRLQARSRNSSLADVPDWERALALDDAMTSSL